MKELSLHILDIVKNSVKAKADLIEIKIDEDRAGNRLVIEIIDDGCGMSEEFLKRVRDPFTTTRTTRKVGMGIPLFEMAAVMAGGSFDISSKAGEGTKVAAVFAYDSIDRAPLGDMVGTMQTIISGDPEIDYLYTHSVDGETFVFDTREIKEILGDVDIGERDIIDWIGGYIREGLSGIDAGN